MSSLTVFCGAAWAVIIIAVMSALPRPLQKPLPPFWGVFFPREFCSVLLLLSQGSPELGQSTLQWFGHTLDLLALPIF